MRKLSLDELGRVDIQEYKALPKIPLVLVLDNIRSALNVGAAFRTADAFAISKIYLVGITAKPPHKEILKTAIGATMSVNWSYCNDIAQCARQLKKDGYQLIGVEQTDESISLQDYNATSVDPVALFFGNEVTGLSDALLPMLDHAIEIPQYGTKHSFNVSVSIGIVLWEVVRQLKA